MAQGTNTDLLFPCQPLPCALRAACPDRCSEFHCMALSPAANHLKLCTAEDGLLLAWKLQTGSSLAKPARFSAPWGLNHTSSKGACTLCRFFLPWPPSLGPGRPGSVSLHIMIMLLLLLLILYIKLLLLNLLCGCYFLIGPRLW